MGNLRHRRDRRHAATHPPRSLTCLISPQYRFASQLKAVNFFMDCRCYSWAGHYIRVHTTHLFIFFIHSHFQAMTRFSSFGLWHVFSSALSLCLEFAGLVFIHFHHSLIGRTLVILWSLFNSLASLLSIKAGMSSAEQPHYQQSPKLFDSHRFLHSNSTRFLVSYSLKPSKYQFSILPFTQTIHITLCFKMASSSGQPGAKLTVEDIMNLTPSTTNGILPSPHDVDLWRNQQMHIHYPDAVPKGISASAIAVNAQPIP